MYVYIYIYRRQKPKKNVYIYIYIYICADFKWVQFDMSPCLPIVYTFSHNCMYYMITLVYIGGTPPLDLPSWLVPVTIS